MGKTLRRTAHVLGYVLGGLLILIALPFLALTFPRGRAAVLDIGLREANERLPIRISIARLDRLDPFGVDLQRLRVTDPQGVLLVELEKLSVRLDPWALTSSKVHLRHVGLEHGFADVNGLITTFTTDEPPAPEEPASEEGGLDIQVDRLEALDLRARAPLGERTLDAHVAALSAAGSYGSRTALVLARLDASVADEQGELASFATRTANFDLATGGHVEIGGHVGDTQVLLRARSSALPEDGGFPDGHVLLRVDGLDEQTLVRLGVRDFSLEKRVNVQVVARAADELLHASVELFGAGQRVLRLDGSGKLDDLKVSLLVTRTDLQSLSSSLPAMTVGGALDASMRGPLDNAEVTATWKGIKIDQQTVPNGTVKAKLGSSSVALGSLTLQDLEKALAVRGNYDWEEGVGDVKLALARTNLASLSWLDTGGARGQVAANIELRGKLEGEIAGHVDVAADGVQVSTTRLARARTKLDLAGTMARPRAKGMLAFSSLDAGSVKVDDAALELKLHGEEGDASFRVRAPNAQLKGLLSLRGRDGGRDVSVSARGAAFEQDLQGSLKAFLARDESITGKLDVALGEQKVAAHGSLSRQKRLLAELQLSAVDLACWSSLIGEPELVGRLDAHATAQGPVETPAVTLELALAELTTRGQPKTNVKLSANADLASRKYAAVLSARGTSDALAVDLDTSIVLPRRARSTLDWLRGPYDAKVRVHLPAERLAMFDPERLAPLHGTADLALSMQGGDEKLEAKLDFDTDLILASAADDRSDKLKLSVKVSEKQASFAAVGDDRDGELVRASGEVTWPKGTLFAAGDQDAWQKPPPFRVAATLAERRIDELQGVYAYLAGIYDLDVPVKLGATLDLHGSGDDLGGALRGKALVMADVLDPTCALGTQVSSTFDVSLERGEVSALVSARDMQGGTVNVRVAQKLVIDPARDAAEWLGPSQLTAQGKALNLRTLPGMCQLSGGKLAFQASAQALDGKPPRAQLDLGVEELRGGRGEPVGLHVAAALTSTSIQAEGEFEVQHARRGGFTFRTDLPPAQPGAFMPEVGLDSKIVATLELNALPVSPFLSVGEAFGKPSGHVSARFRVTGPLRDPRPDGYITLDDVSFTVAQAAQPLKHVNGRIVVRGREVIIERLTGGDLDGKVSMTGRAKLNDDGTGEGKVNLRATKLPLRRQGEIIGELTINADASARIPANKKAEVSVKVNEGRIWLTGDTGRAVQSLEPNPDVRFVDRAGEKQRQEEPTGETSPDGEQQLGFAFMKITSERDMWIMHESFSVQLGLDLRFVQEAEPVMRGEVTLRRGELQLLGKLFTIQRGAIRFVGDSPPDPELDLRAAHKLPNGQQLIVTVTGRGTAPVLAFSGAASNVGEAVQLLTGVGNKTGAETKAQDDAKNFAMNLTAGLLTVAARREFGDWVPVLGIENNAEGAVSGARAGFDASDLIPKALRGFARAAYVEGIVGTGQSANGEPGKLGVGVKLEVVLPADLITSWGYGPGATWSTDIAWAP